MVSHLRESLCSWRDFCQPLWDTCHRGEGSSREETVPKRRPCSKVVPKVLCKKYLPRMTGQTGKQKGRPALLNPRPLGLSCRSLANPPQCQPAPSPHPCVYTQNTTCVMYCPKFNQLHILFAFLEQLEAYNSSSHERNSHPWSTDSLLREPGKSGRRWSRKSPGDVVENVGQEAHRLKTDSLSLKSSHESSHQSVAKGH